jgi:hypothetical protein
MHPKPLSEVTVPTIDDLVAGVDVDAALASVLERDRRGRRRERQQRLAIVAACLVVLVGTTWLVVGAHGDGASVDSAGVPEPPELVEPPPTEAPTTPAAPVVTCGVAPAAIDEARALIEGSPLNAAIDRSPLGSVDQLQIAPGELVTEGRITAVRDVGLTALGSDSGFPEDVPGGPLHWVGAELTVETEAGPVAVPIALWMGGGSGPTQLAIEPLLALEGACVVVRHGTGGTSPMTIGTPRILTLAPDPTSAPLALDPFDDLAYTRFATSAQVVEAIDVGR